MCGPSLSKWNGGHRNFSSLKEMNDTIINNINSMVQKEDTLYHLGDFAMGNRKEIPELRSRINCKNIILVLGNHDEQLQKQFSSLFTQLVPYLELRINKTLVTMMHYPIASWNEIGRGSINLHGHSHGNYKAIGRQYDVGMDCNNLMPLNLPELIAKIITTTPIKSSDHHGAHTNYG